MNALWKLEKGGIRFELTAEGEITYENTWPNVAGRADLTRDWAAPLLDALRRDRDELVIILMARREWMSVYDEWSDLLEEGMDDIERDVAYLERMQDLAISGQLGCYDGDDVDLGAAGWELVTERLIRSIRQTADDRRQTTDP